jgi:hypothetical protein
MRALTSQRWISSALFLLTVKETMPPRSTPASQIVTPAIVLSCRHRSVGQVFDPSPNRLEPPLQGIINGDPEADFARLVGFPIFKTPGVKSTLKTIVCYPLGRM